MKVGRPLKYETPESLSDIDTGLTPWELCPKVQLNKGVEYGRFSTESDFCDFIEDHAEMFCIDLLEDEMIQYSREWDLNAYRMFGARPKRVDFMFKTRNSECILVECKNPHHAYTELRNAVAQLMSYYVTAKGNGVTVDRMVIVSTKHHETVVKMIEEFNLPIEYYLLKRGQILKAQINTN